MTRPAFPRRPRFQSAHLSRLTLVPLPTPPTAATGERCAQHPHVPHRTTCFDAGHGCCAAEQSAEEAGNG